MFTISLLRIACNLSTMEFKLNTVGGDTTMKSRSHGEASYDGDHGSKVWHGCIPELGSTAIDQ
jgi:hypothetical protein